MGTITTETLQSLGVAILCVVILIAGFKATSKKKGGSGKSNGSNNDTSES